MDNFYIVLPSNTNNNNYENTSSHFKTTLLNPIDLKHDYECCLHEISYYQSFNTINKRNNQIKFYGHKKEDPSVSFHTIYEGYKEAGLISDGDFPNEFAKAHEFAKPQGWYAAKRLKKSRTVMANIPVLRVNDIAPVIEAINDIKPKFWDSQLKIKRKYGRRFVQIELNKFALRIEFNPVLAQMLGFKNNAYEWGKEQHHYTILGDKIEYFDPDGVRVDLSNPANIDKDDICIITASIPADIKACFYNIFVYSNIIKDTIVGNSLVPLLRTVQLSDLRNPYVTRTFTHNIYSPLKTLFIPEIEILLCDETGNQIEFNAGKTIVILHFRKIRRML